MKPQLRLENDDTILIVGRSRVRMDPCPDTICLRTEGTEFTFLMKWFLAPNWNIDKIKATCAHGILRIKISKKKATRPRSIEFSMGRHSSPFHMICTVHLTPGLVAYSTSEKYGKYGYQSRWNNQNTIEPPSSPL